MYIIIESNEDGETYQITSSLSKGEKIYETRSRELEDEVNNFILAKVKEDVEFGFGARGDFFGGEIIKSLLEPVD